MPVQRAEGYWNLGLDFLDSGNYIAANRSLIKAFGLNLAVIIGELASEARYWKREGKLQDGWFFSTVENIEKATGINGYYQRDAIKQLQTLGFIEIKYKDAPRKRYFRINGMNIIQTIAQIEEEEETAGERQCFTQCTINDAPSAQLMTHPVDDNNHKEQPQPTKKKERKNTAETYDSIIDGFTQDEELREALRDFLQYKVASCHRAKKEFTNRALKVNLTKLSKLTSDPREMVEIVNQTLERSWSGFFPLKSDYSQKRQPTQQKLEISEPRIGSMRIDNMTGRQEVYKGNGVWEDYVSDYVPQEGDVDIAF
jgi:hypothetical protein